MCEESYKECINCGATLDKYSDTCELCKTPQPVPDEYFGDDIMANNKERMPPLETFHMFLALRRNKTNKDVPDHKEMCFHQVIRDYDTDLKLLKTRISSFPGTWRIHRTINERNLQRSRIWMMKKLIDTDGSYDYRIDTLWKRALMNCPIKKNILVDIDTTDVMTKAKVVTILSDNNIKILEKMDTPNGYHIVCPTFDTRLIMNIEDVGYRRDGYIFLEEITVK